jgi:SAM-dependent methyltransferase
VGNLVFPLLQTDLELYCCDFSPVAIGLVNDKLKNLQLKDVMDTEVTTLVDSSRVHPFVCDFSEPVELSRTYDIVTSVFCLSAIHFTNHLQFFKNILLILNEQGRFCFRDYAHGDQAQTRYR